MAPVQVDGLFEVLFQAMIDERKGGVVAMDSLVMFTVVGEAASVWTLDLRRGGTGKVLPGKVDNPDLHLILQTDFLEDFLSGNFDPAEAIEGGQLGVEGSIDALTKFIHFLAGESAAQAAQVALQPPSGPSGAGLRLRRR